MLINSSITYSIMLNNFDVCAITLYIQEMSSTFVDVLALLCGEGRDGFGLVLVVCAAESGYFAVNNLLGKKGLLRTGM